ncbi:hypothetical protein BG015_001637, partial [Linnemannia schmuckeri]
MACSLERFLDITELIDLLATLLTLSDIARLMRTCHALHDAFEPCFYRNLEAPTIMKPRLFSHIAAVQALARNIRHVRQWDTKVYDTAYVYNGLLAFQKEFDYFTFSASVPVAAFGKPGSRPPWLPPPDDLYSNVTPLAPMANLVKLNMALDTHTELDPGPYNRMGIFRVRRSLYHACWILQSSCCLNLVDLGLSPLVIRSRRDLRLVTATIGGLANLSSLNLGLVADIDVSWEYCQTILYSCPPSLRKFCIFKSRLFRGPRVNGWEYDRKYEEDDDRENNRNEEAEEASEDDDNKEVQQDIDSHEQEGEHNVVHSVEEERSYGEAEDEYSESEEEYNEAEEENSEDDEEDSWEDEEEDFEEDDLGYNSEDYIFTDTDDSGSDRDMDGLPEIFQRASPLVSLSYLNPWDIEYDTTLEDISAFFSYCPNIDQLELSQTYTREDLDAVARTILNTCPKITTLSYNAFTCDSFSDNTFMFRILEHMPEHQVRKIIFSSAKYPLDPFLARRAFQRHSDSLRSLHLERALEIPSKSFQAIFQECRGLEELYIHWINRYTECYFALSDAVSGEWVCSKMRRLEIIVEVLEPTDGPEQLPYYDRDSPLVLSKDEFVQFTLLEELYRRLGAMRELEYLDIRARNPLKARYCNEYIGTTLPAMLSLGDPASNRPGYLDFFKDLKKLQWLRGSVLTNTDETVETV